MMTEKCEIVLQTFPDEELHEDSIELQMPNITTGVRKQQ